MSRGGLVAREVELWDRTPFHPHAAARGAGVDCKGLLYGVARDLRFPEAQTFYATCIDYDLTRKTGLPHELLLEGFQRLFERTDEITPGCPLLLNVRGKPSHIAIASRTDGRAWHAQIEPNAFVKEASTRSLFKMFPPHSFWRWRELNAD